MRYFLGLIVCSLLAGAAFTVLGEAKSLRCNPRGIDDDWYIAYCEEIEGHQDHPAFLFGIADAPSAAQTADVLMLGNSTIQIAFSNTVARDFFDASPYSFFVMGFGHTESVRWMLEVLEARPYRPKVALLNLSSQWLDLESSERADYLLHHRVETSIRTWVRFQYQRLQRRACPPGAAGPWCGHAMTGLRSRSTGIWDDPVNSWFAGTREERGRDCAVPPNENGDLVCKSGHTLRSVTIADAEPYNSREARNLRRVIDLLDISPECVFVTATPQDDTPIHKARAIAADFGLTFIEPDMEGLYTADKVHLYLSSAELYSERFLPRLMQAAAPCLSGATPQSAALDG